MIRGVHHTSFSTRNLDAMAHFYRNLLGLEQVAQMRWEPGRDKLDTVVGLQGTSGRHIMLRADNMYVEIFEYATPTGTPANHDRRACDVGLVHICFDVVGVDAEYDRLKAAGVIFHSPPQQLTSVRACYGRDPTAISSNCRNSGPPARSRSSGERPSPNFGKVETPFSAGSAKRRHSVAMRIVLLAALAALSTPTFADPPEDAAHRADRLRTEQLNKSAAAIVERRDRQNARIRKGGDDAQQRYQRQLAEWRRRVDDCRAGNYAACN